MPDNGYKIDDSAGPALEASNTNLLNHWSIWFPALDSLSNDQTSQLTNQIAAETPFP